MFDIVQDILEKADKGPVAVFKIDGKVKIVPVSSTKRYNSMINDYHREWVGVFTNTCPIAVLKENLK